MCFAGAVGLEAMSRGCQECHFVEMDPTVARDSLARNIAECGLAAQATVHSMVSTCLMRSGTLSKHSMA